MTFEKVVIVRLMTNEGHPPPLLPPVFSLPLSCQAFPFLNISNPLLKIKSTLQQKVSGSTSL